MNLKIKRTCLLLVALSWSLANAQAQDTLPPALVDLLRTPSVVDTTSGDATVDVTIELTDDLSGLSSGFIQYRSPSGARFEGVSISAIDRISGDALNGIYVDSLTFDQFTEPGIWTPDFLRVIDEVGNLQDFNTNDLANLGFDLDIDVVSNEDLLSPSLLNISRTPSVVDTTSGSSTVDVTIELTDDLSGLSSGFIQYRSPSGARFEGVSISAIDRISGDALNGIYVDSLTFDQFTEPGIWTPDFLRVIDEVGNLQDFNTNDLANLGFDLNITVVPEPSTLLLTLLSTVSLFFRRQHLAYQPLS